MEDPFYIVGTGDEIEIWRRSHWADYYRKTRHPDPIAQAFYKKPAHAAERNVTRHFGIHWFPMDWLSLSADDKTVVLEPISQEGKIGRTAFYPRWIGWSASIKLSRRSCWLAVNSGD